MRTYLPFRAPTSSVGYLIIHGITPFRNTGGDLTSSRLAIVLRIAVKASYRSRRTMLTTSATILRLSASKRIRGVVFRAAST